MDWTLVTAASITAAGATAGAWLGLRGKRESERAADIRAAAGASVEETKSLFASSGEFRRELLTRVKELEDKLDERTAKYEARMAEQDARNAELSNENHDLARKLKEAQSRIAELEAEVAALKAKQVVS